MESKVYRGSSQTKDSMKKVLVTGATGFIGRHVVKALLKHDLDVITTSRNQYLAKDVEWYKDVEYLPYDFNKGADSVYKYFHKPDVIVDLAWEGLPNYHNLAHFEINVPSHYRFIKQMVEAGSKSVVVAGSCLEYGLVDGEVTEKDLTNPITAYGLAKDTLRKYLQLLKETTPFNFNWMRLFYVYGDGQNAKSLYQLLEQAVKNEQLEFKMSEGKQVRDFIHVSDVAGYIAAVAANQLDCGLINIGSGKPITVKEFVENTLKKHNHKMNLKLGYYPYTDYEPMSFWASTSKLSKCVDKYL